jgi:hypothetical protein
MPQRCGRQVDIRHVCIGVILVVSQRAVTGRDFSAPDSSVAAVYLAVELVRRVGQIFVDVHVRLCG